MVVKKGKEKQKHECVCVVIHYDKHMHRVHNKAELLNIYRVDRKTENKCYINSFRRLLNATVLNSLVIYGQNVE